MRQIHAATTRETISVSLTTYSDPTFDITITRLNDVTHDCSIDVCILRFNDGNVFQFYFESLAEMCLLHMKENQKCASGLKERKLTLRLLFQQYAGAGGGPTVVFETEPTSLS